MLEVANLMYFDGLKENAKTNKYMLSYKYKKYNKLSNIQIKNILIWFDLDRQKCCSFFIFCL